MVDRRTEVSIVQLKGPAGSVTVDKRIEVSLANLHGPVDIRTIVNEVALVAPPLPKKTLVSQLQLVGPNSPVEPMYYGAASGWVPVYVYLGVGVDWVKSGP